MSQIVLTAKINKQSYTKLMMKVSYSKPVTLFFSLFGTIIFILSITNITSIYVTTDQSPLTGLLFGILTVIVIPGYSYWANGKSFDSNYRLQEEIQYTFCQDIITMKGESFNAEMTWDKIHMVKELNDWILIYQTKSSMNLLPKSAFNSEQLKKFRMLVSKFPSIKKKLSKS